MTVRELQKRNDKAQALRVIEVGAGNYFVESSSGKVAYKCRYAEDGNFCTCGDYQKNAGDADFLCKHLLAVAQCLTEGETEKKGFLQRRQPQLNREFVKSIEGKDFVTYQGLLDLAHQRGLSRIEVEIVQNPTADNQHTAIVRAVAESKLGEVFSDVGDANPTNTNSKVSRHLLRMASTRAKARCLRDLTNIGMTCLEELGDLNEMIGDNSQPGKASQGRRKTPDKGAAASQTTGQRQNEASQTVAGKGQSTEAKGTSQTASDSGDRNLQTNSNASGQNKASNPAKDDNGSGKGKPGMSEAQNRAIANLSRRRGLSLDQVGAMSLEMFGVELDHISAMEASSLIRHLQQAA